MPIRRPALSSSDVLLRVAETATSRRPLDQVADYALDPSERSFTSYRADGQHLTVYYGPGQSVRLVTRESLTGPIIAGATLAPHEVTTEAVLLLEMNVLRDTYAIVNARASYPIPA